MLLLASDAVARAHHAALGVQALADADAPPGVARELRARGNARWRDEDPQVVVELAGLHDPAGVEQVVRIERVLEVLERLDRRGRVHPAEQLGAGLPVAVLA